MTHARIIPDKQGSTRAKICTRARALGTPRSQTPTLIHAHKYVLLTAFPHQQWFRNRAPLLRYTYIVCLVKLVLSIKVSLLPVIVCRFLSDN